MRFSNPVGTVIIADDGRSIPADPTNKDYAAIIASGAVVEPFVPQPATPADYAAAIEAHIEATALAKSYSGAVSLASYANSTIPQWAAEASSFVAWRDAVWAYAYAQLAAVQGGQRAQPTVSELVAESPAIEWPTP